MIDAQIKEAIEDIQLSSKALKGLFDNRLEKDVAMPSITMHLGRIAVRVKILQREAAKL